MKTLLYISTATIQFTDKDLTELLENARTHNKCNNLTGALLLINDLFLQILEGEEEAINDLMDKIQKDDRHKDIQVLIEEEIEERLFDDWSMAFKRTSQEELVSLGYFSLEDFAELSNSLKEIDIFKVVSGIINANLKSQEKY